MILTVTDEARFNSLDYLANIEYYVIIVFYIFLKMYTIINKQKLNYSYRFLFFCILNVILFALFYTQYKITDCKYYLKATERIVAN